MSEKKKEEKIGEALMKVALGYQIAEITEEYAEVDGELKLTKRKKTKKDIPPDLKAVQLLLSSGESADYGQWTDEALEKEKARLLAELQKKGERVATDTESAEAATASATSAEIATVAEPLGEAGVKKRNAARSVKPKAAQKEKTKAANVKKAGAARSVTKEKAESKKSKPQPRKRVTRKTVEKKGE